MTSDVRGSFDQYSQPSGLTSRAIQSTIFANFSNENPSGLVTQFTFVPEPASAFLIVVGGAVLIGCRRIACRIDRKNEGKCFWPGLRRPRALFQDAPFFQIGPVLRVPPRASADCVIVKPEGSILG